MSKKQRYGLALSEIAPKQRLIWNWCGGTPVTVLRIDGQRLIITGVAQRREFTATVYPGSLRLPDVAPGLAEVLAARQEVAA